MTDLSGLRILVAEDDYFIAMDVAGALRKRGATIVGPVGNLKDALRLSNDNIDAAVLDINFAGQMVYDVAAALSARHIPFIFTTGYDHAVIPKTYAGAEYFEKPFDHKRMAAALGAACRSASA